jgi:hypothetical protein
MEDQALRDGVARVKFTCKHLGDAAHLVERYERELLGLGQAVNLLEQLGVAPVMQDGKVAGNGAMVLRTPETEPLMIVTRSGRRSCRSPAEVHRDDFCFVTGFDFSTWSASYYGANEPSSDTPLLWAALQVDYGWTAQPVVALHG